MHRPFSVSWEGILPGDPQQVWEAITRRAAGWIWEIDYEPRVGGAERGLTGAGGTVTVWDPPHHFQTRARRPGGWRNQLDYRLEPHGEGTRVRYLHEATAEEGEFDEIVAGCRAHTPFYLHSMGEYVAHFAGREAAYAGVDGDVSFAAVCDRLGLAPEAAVGDVVRLEPGGGLAPIAGVVDYRAPQFLGVRGEELLFRVYGREVWNAPSTIALHQFGPGADGAATARAWTTWMNETEAVA